MKVIKSIFGKIHPVVLIAPVLTFFLTSTMFVGATVNVPNVQGNAGGLALGGGFGEELGGNACEGGVAASYRQNQLPVPATPLNISGNGSGLIRAHNSVTSGYAGNDGIVQNSSPRCIANFWRGEEASQITRRIDPAGGYPVDYIFDLAQFDGPVGIPPIPQVVANNSDEDKFGLLISTQNPGILQVFESSPGSRAVRATFYVDGDLIISSDISNNDEPFYTTRADLGYLTFVVSGDIYIGSAVSSIDAVLVALDKGPANTNPTIYTCADISDVTNPTDVAGGTGCGNLAINGSLIAQTINNDNRDLSVTLGTEYYYGLPAQVPLTSGVYRSDSLQTLPPVF